MIPYRMQFAGIRDFLPSSIDLSDKGHIMITGPNGSGKSTLSFCMGAVLYSSKVDIEGLKSRNLPSNQVWKAHISLLFQNDGPTKIDEPAFIQFTIFIVQEPGQPIKKEFIVQKGEYVDEWDEKVKYTSGDRYFNFSQYKKDLQFRYKIDPDLFYLIWYQQEVNQFAVMHPEERFRIFSEMHGIDNMQKNWEESMEKVKDAEETLLLAEQNMKYHKQNLHLLKRELDRLIDNQRRLRNGAQQSLEALQSLEQLYNREIHLMEDIVHDLEGQLEDNRDKYSNFTSQRDASSDEIQELEKKYEQLEETIDNFSQQIEQENKQLEKMKTERDVLEQELKELMAKQKKIEHTEEEAKQEFVRLKKEHRDKEQGLYRLQEQMEEKDDLRTEKLSEKANLQAIIQQEDKLELVHVDRLNTFKSSFAMQQSIDSLSEKIQSSNDQLHRLRQEKVRLRDEEKALLEDRNISDRQKESMAFFRAKDIEAFPLRELIELDETAKLTDENRFNSIKYTIFFNGKSIVPPNDLYHVSLMNIIPERWADQLPELHLKVKANLSDENYNFAVKALYWIKQFFKETEPSIHKGVLIDARGLRGPQESQGYILSKRAIQIRLKEVREEIEIYNHQTAIITKEVDSDIEQYQYLNSEIQKVREAEAFMTKRHEREQRKEKALHIQQEITELNLVMKELGVESNSRRDDIAKLSEQLRVIQNELNFYEELGQRKEKYEKLQQLEKLFEETAHKVKLLENDQEKRENELEQLARLVTKVKRNRERTVQRLEDIKREIDQLSIQIQQNNDRIDSYKNELIKVIQDLHDIKELVPEIYEDFSNSFEETSSLSKEALKTQLQNGKITFQTARNEEGIDPAAKDNYEKAEEEFKRLEREFQQSKVLLEADKERTERLKEDLETTINMRVLEIQKRFTVYMGEFQFQGDISWESNEDKKGRTHFKLFIKARKEGHRGTMEDVSVKARGGKVGKGVSGGEESLSSLLFALALLQNLETAPGFIVLDEFDSALDEHRKSKVFDLYVQQLQRKLIILTPKTHEEEYIKRFHKAFVVQHDPRVPESRITGVKFKQG